MSFRNLVDDIENVVVTELNGIDDNPDATMNVQANADGSFALAAAGGGGGGASVPTYGPITLLTISDDTSNPAIIPHPDATGTAADGTPTLFRVNFGRRSGNTANFAVPLLDANWESPRIQSARLFAVSQNHSEGAAVQTNRAINYQGTWDTANDRFNIRHQNSASGTGSTAAGNLDQQTWNFTNGHGFNLFEFGDGGWMEMDIVATGQFGFNVASGQSANATLTYYTIT